MRLVVDLLLEIERPGARLVRRRRRWIVAQFGVVHRKVDRVDAKPVNPALQPEAHDTQQRVLHVAVVDVELRLRAEEIKIGRASCRERVCQSVWISVVDGTFKKNKTK